MRRNDSSPQAYRDDVTGELGEMLETVRSVIFEVAPEIEERIEHGMLDFPGLCNLAAQKNYVALYVRPAVLARYASSFPGVSCGKSCLRFRRSDQIEPEALRSLLKAVLEVKKAP